MSETTTAGPVKLIAPLTGIMMPIEQVPDPVFAKKMVGEGFSIDPLNGQLVSPIAGEVIDLQPSGHAVTIRSQEGLEILIHIGLDTVKMQGEGFDTKVKEGQSVDIGDSLIDFDLDVIANNAKSLLTQVVVTNSERVASVTPVTGLVNAGEDVAAEFELAEVSDDTEAATGRPHSSGAILVPNPTGLHARPAATLVSLAKKYNSDIRVRRGDDSANAKSIVSIMGLAIGCAEKVTITAHGKDAEEAIEELSKAIETGLGEDCPPLPSGTEDTGPIPAIKEEVIEDRPGPLSGDPNLLLGVAASPGLGIGTVFQLRHEDIVVEEFAEDHHKERRKLNAAIDRALLDLSALEKRLEKEASADKAAIFAAHQEILGDPDLLDLVQQLRRSASGPQERGSRRTRERRPRRWPASSRRAHRATQRET